MDNLKIDLNITNYQPHPERHGYMIIHYRSKKEADHFEASLKEQDYFYEAATETQNNNGKEQVVRYLYGVRTTDFEKINVLNYAAIGTYRKPFITDKASRLVITIIGIGLVLFAFAGYLHSKGII